MMSSEKTSDICAKCGRPILDESPSVDSKSRKPCPNCGSTSRVFSLSGTITATTSVTAKAEVITYPKSLLNIARDLIDDGKFSIAVVVTHMASEVAIQRALSEAFSQKRVKYLQEPVYEFLSGYNLANNRVRKLYMALTGDEIQKKPFWDGFKKSAKRRNDIIHEGAIINEMEAEDSYRAVSELIAHLGK